MSRGFGSTFGSGTTDTLLSVASPAYPTQYSVFIRAYRNGDGGGTGGRFYDWAIPGSASILLHQASDQTTIFSTPWNSTSGQWKFTSPSTGQWNDFCVTYDGGSTSNDPVMYLNAVAQSLTESSTPAGSLLTGTAQIYVGNRADAARNWDGMLAEFNQWNIILTPAEVLALSSGANPSLIRPQNNFNNLPIDGVSSPEFNLTGSPFTVTGTRRGTSRPVVGPRSRDRMNYAALSSFNPAWARHANQIIQPGMRS